MVIWGGDSGTTTQTGGLYDPVTNSWVDTTTVNAPSPRLFHSAVWTGSEMIVWGGNQGSHSVNLYNTGGRYDPVTDAWTPTSSSGAPSARARHTGVWTGDRLVVWGGTDETLYYNTGGRYDPVADTWSATWDVADVADLQIAGDDVKVYNIPTQLDIAVIEFATNLIDATSMTHLHIDIWVPQGTASTPFFGLGLFSFGPDGVFSGSPPPQGDDSQCVVAILEPQLVFGQWLSLDIPLSDFTEPDYPPALEETAHLAQIILRSDAVQLIVDNIYFYNDGS